MNSQVLFVKFHDNGKKVEWITSRCDKYQYTKKINPAANTPNSKVYESKYSEYISFFIRKIMVLLFADCE